MKLKCTKCDILDLDSRWHNVCPKCQTKDNLKPQEKKYSYTEQDELGNTVARLEVVHGDISDLVS